MFVTGIKLEDYNKDVLVGEKYLLPILLEPSDASEKKLYFGVSEGSASQIKEED